MVKTRINIHMDNYDDHTKDILREVYLGKFNSDIILRVGKKRYPAHKVVLAFGSDFLKELIEENEKLQPGSITTITLPDIDPEIVEQILNFIYTGETRIKEERFMEFVDVCNLLKLKSMANYEYVRYVQTTEEQILQQEPQTVQSYENMTVIGDDYAEIVKSVTQEEHTADESELVYETSQLVEPGHYDVIEIIEQQPTTEDEQDRKPFIPSLKKKRLSNNLREGDPTYQESLQAALNDIIRHKLSFKAASEKHNISKTILWRTCQASPEYQAVKREDPVNEELNQTIKEELGNGETLLGLSKKINIPVSTLHRRKALLFEKGDLPQNVRIKQRNRGEDFSIRLGLALVEIENGLSQTEAAKKYNIPKTTIWRRLKKPSVKQERTFCVKTEALEEHEQYEVIHANIEMEGEEAGVEYKILQENQEEEIEEHEQVVGDEFKVVTDEEHEQGDDEFKVVSDEMDVDES